jgi:alanine dehydrogenase
MRIGVPKEIKNHEYRVGLTPASVAELVAAGHELVVETNAGNGIDCPDAAFAKAGATILPDAAAVFAASDMIVKVKEPQPQEIALLEPRHILFTYLHLAADKPQAEGLMQSGATCIAYETVTSRSGALPLLKPMSEVAGRMSVQVGAHYLEKEQGGRGVLLGGVPGVARPRSRSSAAASRASTRRRWRSECARTSPSTTSTTTAWPNSTCSSRARSRRLMPRARRSPLR